MLSGDMAREQIQDRVRAAARDHQAGSVSRNRTRKVGSGLLVAVASLRLRPRSSKGASTRVARTAV